VSGPLPNVDEFFVVADSDLKNLYQVAANSGATRQLMAFGVASAPKAVAYDPTDRLIYWTDVKKHTINRYLLITKVSSVVYRDPNNTGKYTYIYS